MSGRPVLGSADRLLDQLRGPASSFEKLEAILRCPITYALAEAIPDKPHAGRPRDYPRYMSVVYHALVNHVWASARRVEAELCHPDVWGFIRRVVTKQLPDNPELWLPANPMRRWHYAHACTYLRDPVILQAMKDVQREEACKLAIELGLFGEAGTVSWTHPDPNRYMQADGKVITPMYRGKRGQQIVDRATGEIRAVRFDPDATRHTEGGGNSVIGNKYVIVSARNEYERVLLDIEYDSGRKGDGGEASVAMRCFERLAPSFAGAQGVNYDKAMRGAHIDHAMRELGWLIQTGVHARKDDAGRPIEWHIEDVTVHMSGGRDATVSIFAREGAAGLKELTETGEPLFIPLERIKTERRGDAGRYRFYNVYRLPPEYGSGELRVRLTGTEEDERRGLNRAEHLRAIPPSDPDFSGLFRRRNDAESLNRGIEDSLYWTRAHSVGAPAQEADLIGFALGLNALSWHRHYKRQTLAAVA